MKVETKIVETTEKAGWFGTRPIHQLQFKVIFTEVEVATIKKAGLKNFEYLPATERTGGVPWTINMWLDQPKVFSDGRDYAYRGYPNLIEAQSNLQLLKSNLQELKRLMDASASIGTEDSFEL